VRLSQPKFCTLIPTALLVPRALSLYINIFHLICRNTGEPLGREHASARRPQGALSPPPWGHACQARCRRTSKKTD
jgi:hypothetical protein